MSRAGGWSVSGKAQPKSRKRRVGEVRSAMVIVYPGGPVETKIQKWGNSLGVRIPRSVAAEARVEAGSTVDVSVDKGSVRIRPKRRRLSLGELLRGVKPENLHREVGTGAAIGREAW